jgi:hypothetical protein
VTHLSGSETDDSTGQPYRAPLRWRLAGLPLVVIVIVALILMFPQHNSWRTLLPLACALLCLACGIGLRFARTPARAAVLALGQLAAGLGGLILLTVI